MIKHWIFTGDTHGQVAKRLKYIKNKYPNFLPEETAVIILGDVGLNYYLNKKDEYEKERVDKTGYTLYCLRGNHEERPSLLNYPIVYDADVCGDVYVQPEHPNIKYLLDGGGVYYIGGFNCLTVPSAYSVDKFYRLQNDWKWFPFEQLCETEQTSLEAAVSGWHFDFVLSHTCPIDWEPNDLFLNIIDQSTVDKSMEIWLSELKKKITWTYWLFGHYHADRFERPNVLQMFEEAYELSEMLNIMDKPYYIDKAPGYYMGLV